MITTIIAAVLIALTLLVAGKTLQEAKATTKVARDVGEQAEKALAIINKIHICKKDEFIFSGNHKVFCLNANWEILGKTPAFSVEVFSKLTVEDNGAGRRTFNAVPSHHSKLSPKPLVAEEGRATILRTPLFFVIPNELWELIYDRQGDEKFPPMILTLITEVMYDDIFTVGTKRERNRVLQMFQATQLTLENFTEIEGTQIDRVQRGYQPYKPAELPEMKPPPKTSWDDVY